MRARFLANASMSTAPIFAGAGAASFMVTPPLQAPGGRAVLVWTYYPVTRVPDQYIEFTPISRLLPHLCRGGRGPGDPRDQSVGTDGTARFRMAAWGLPVRCDRAPMASHYADYCDGW